ncbi:hypothetical protein [Actinomyces bovis]|uniref:hypothetical protein n=1 Tax=Actinomyces bovis TaxID=1658 RepID=UPI000DD0D2BA|nr:hypothetical protein [Actinomyces bovis]
MSASEWWFAVILLVLIGLRLKLPGGVNFGNVLAVLALPITWQTVRRSKLFTILSTLTIIALLSGFVLLMLHLHWATFVRSEMITSIFLVTLFPAVAAAIAWGAERLTLPMAVAAYSAGLTFIGVRNIPTTPNPWKYVLGYPTTVLVLALVDRSPRWVQLLALVGLAGLWAINDSRSILGYMAMIIALLIWQFLAEKFVIKARTPRFLAAFQVSVLGALMTVVMIAIVTAAASGLLGDSAKARTQAQASSSTNVVLSARPEAAATWGLLKHRPEGFGLGIKPGYDDERAAMYEMHGIEYDPENGYVYNYIFGHGVELHSSTSDLWAATGIPGIALALFCFCLVIAALVRNLGSFHLSPWLFFVAIGALWDTFFSPLITSAPGIAVTIGALLAMRPLSQQADLVRGTGPLRDDIKFSRIRRRS